MMVTMRVGGIRGTYDKTGFDQTSMGITAIAISLVLVLSSQTACARLILRDPFPLHLGGVELEARLDRRDALLSETFAPPNGSDSSTYYSVADYNTSVDEKRITTLPGFTGRIPSPHYAGYVHLIPKRSLHQNLDPNPDPVSNNFTTATPSTDPVVKSFFYYFVESERSPTTDPVVLWLNGGPGCSSMFGFAMINGPFRFAKPSKSESQQSQHLLPKLSVNPFSWSKVANMIYLDSPFGVGLSLGPLQENDGWPDDSSMLDDWQTSLDLHAVMLAWVKAHPSFRSNPIYLAGESYAGVYIPMLAMKIVEGTDNNHHLLPHLNLKGYLIGNGVAEAEEALGFESVGRVEAARGLSLITEEMYRWVTIACGGSRQVMADSWRASNSCRSAAKAFAYLFLGYTTFRRVDIYNTLGPCESDLWPSFTAYHDVMSSISRNMSRRNLTNPADVVDPDNVMNLLLDRLTSYPSSNGSRFCDDHDWLGAWFNNAQVRTAINVPPVAEIGNWTSCSDLIHLLYWQNGGNMVPIHRKLTSKYGLRVLIYSGDHDLVVPTTASEAWLRYLGYGEAFPGALLMERWRVGDRTAGFVQYYEKNLTFATVLGAGHAAPKDKPAEAFELFSSWIDKSGSFKH